jgi:hypothetical protein
MGNSLEEYRAAIGMFHSHTCRLCGPFVIRTDTYLNIFRTKMGNYSGYIKLHWKKVPYVINIQICCIIPVTIHHSTYLRLNILHYIIDNFIHLYIINTINFIFFACIYTCIYILLTFFTFSSLLLFLPFNFVCGCCGVSF